MAEGEDAARAMAGREGAEERLFFSRSSNEEETEAE